MNRLLYLSLLILTIIGCSKTEELNTQIDQPVFNITVTADTTHSKNLIAGIDGYYLFTKASTIDSNISRSESSFAQASCPDGQCPESVKIIFDNVNFNDIQDEVSIGFAINGQSPNIYQTLYHNPGTAEYDNFALNIDGNKITLGIDSTAVITNQTGNSDVWSFTATHNSGIESTISGSISYEGQNIIAHQTGIRISKNVGAQYFIEGLGADNSKYSWSTGISNQKFFADSVGLQNNYSVTTTDINGKTATAQLKNLIGNFVSDSIKTAAIHIDITKKNINGGVIVQWISQNGTIWRSDFGDQDIYNSFQIITASEYEEKNADAQTVVKLKFTCSGKLYDGSGNESPLFIEGIVGMAKF